MNLLKKLLFPFVYAVALVDRALCKDWVLNFLAWVLVVSVVNQVLLHDLVVRYVEPKPEMWLLFAIYFPCNMIVYHLIRMLRVWFWANIVPKFLE